MRWAGLLFLWLLFIGQARAQQTIDFNASYSKGFILTHTPGIAHLATSHPTIYTLSAYKKTFGEKPWQSDYNYPDIGATFIYLDYHNPVLGKSISLIPNYNFHFLHPEKAINGHFRIGIGPSYHTNPYDKEENNKNNVLGSQLTYGIILQTDATFRLSERIAFLTGISLTHFSNGSIKKPNKGINVISWTSGLTYTFGELNKVFKIDSTERNFSKRWHFTGTLSGGMSETIKIGVGTYPFFNLQLAMDKLLNHKRRVSGGIEYFHTISLREEIKHDPWLEGETPDWKRLAVVVGYEQLFNKLSTIYQAGYYIYQPYKEFDPFYIRIGLRYALSPNIFAGLAVKSHYFKAEATEWSVGYRF